MDDTGLIALGTLALTAVLIPLAKWVYGLIDRANKAEAKLAYYESDVPKAVAELKRAADTMRHQATPSPYGSLRRRSRRSAPRSGRR
jgi:hypothetical protein